MSRIIIQNNSTASDARAVSAVLNVMSEGRVSKNDTCYCYVTTFPSIGIAISAELTRTGNDKFTVWDKP